MSEIRKTKSIIENQECCYICKGSGYTESHHIFNGSNRKHSEKYGLKVNLCPTCHRDNNLGVHGNGVGKRNNLRLKVEFQVLFEELYSHELFMKLLRRSYLD